MEKLKQGIFVATLFSLSLFSSLVHAQTGADSYKESLEWFPFYWEGDSISGQYIERAYLYVPLKIEDLPYDFSMQFDLGTPETQFYGMALKPYVEESAALRSKLDPESKNTIFRKVDLHMGNVDFKFDVWNRNDFGEEPTQQHSEKPIHVGTIAADVFQDKILVIDYKSSRLALSDRLPAEYEELPAGKFELNNGIIILPFRIDGKENRLMFDTGSSPFPLATSRERALEISDGMLTDSLSGPLWWGNEITFYGMKVNKPIELEGKTFENATVYYDKEGLWEGIFNSMNIWGLTGNAFFLDKVVIVDYKNKTFRIK